MNPGTRQNPILGSKLPGSARRRQALGEFLRSRRERLDPERLGLRSSGRRRTPGLRREEVAQIAGVSTAWYTWLEQGRDIRPSASALEAIAGALRLPPEERAHAFALAGRTMRAETPPAPATVPPSIQQMLDAQAFPAYVGDRMWNILAWNAPADALLGFSGYPPRERNSMLIVFEDAAFRARMINWAEEAAHLAAGLRLAADESPEVYEPLIERLRASPEFRRLWARHEVRRRTFARKRLRHPRLGELGFETQSYQNGIGLRLVVYVPDEVTRRKLARVAESKRRSPPRRKK